MAWKEANPDAEERPSIAMPYDVELKDGTIVTIESEDDLIALFEDCSRSCSVKSVPWPVSGPPPPTNPRLSPVSSLNQKLKTDAARISNSRINAANDPSCSYRLAVISSSFSTAARLRAAVAGACASCFNVSGQR